MSGGPEDYARDHKRIKRADDFRPLEFDKSGNLQKPTEDEVEQRVLLNSLDILQGALWMLKREFYRHQKDILAIKKDIEKLERMGIMLPPSLRLDLWFEIPEKDPRTLGGVK